MRTLGVMSKEAKKRIANETLDIYAHCDSVRYEVRMEFEDLGWCTHTHAQND